MENRFENWAENSKEDNTLYHYGDHVHVVDTAFFIPQLKKHRKIWIYLPKGYNKSQKKYPVLYMQDGQHLFHTNPRRTDEWAVDSSLDSLIREGGEEIIVVGIDHAEKERITEYNPYDSKYGTGKGRQYSQFLVETLKPFIDTNYRTITDARNTSIAGASMGGLIAMYALAEYPNIFGSAGIFSPALWIAPNIFNYLTERLPLLDNNRFYFVVGDKEGSTMINSVKKAFDIVNNGHSKNIVFSKLPYGKHTEWFWHQEFIPFYKWLTD